jgi:hypothetical protein
VFLLNRTGEQITKLAPSKLCGNQLSWPEYKIETNKHVSVFFFFFGCPASELASADEVFHQLSAK